VSVGLHCVVCSSIENVKRLKGHYS